MGSIAKRRDLSTSLWLLVSFKKGSLPNLFALVLVPPARPNLSRLASPCRRKITRQTSPNSFFTSHKPNFIVAGCDSSRFTTNSAAP